MTGFLGQVQRVKGIEHHRVLFRGFFADGTGKMGEPPTMFQKIVFLMCQGRRLLPANKKANFTF
jgi:hypothetical protein